MDIFSAIKHGDFNRVVYLVEEQGVSLQQRDAWDATPLYYASYTGNEKLVALLLSKGATCEEKTFDGERCLYGALNSGVRRLLLDQGFKRAGARRHDLYLEFLEKLLGDAQAFPDIKFAFSGVSIAAHRFILSARCPMLGRLISERWRGQRVVSSLGRLDAASLCALVKWCYTCRLEVPVSASGACQQLLRALRMHELADRLQEDDTELTGEESSLAVIEPNREDAKAELQSAMDRTAEACCSADSPCSDSLHADILLRAGGRSFRAHRAMLCGRSEYFAVMLGNPNFREGQACEPQELSLEDADPEVVATSLRWIYTDRVDADLPAEHLLLTMRLADRLLSEGLKQKAGVLLQPHVNPSTALFLLEEASRMEVDRLADACLRVIAQHLSTLAKEPQFAELVRDSAAGVEKREDVDSVPLVDDLRFHLADIYGDGELSDDDSDWDEEGNLICSGLDADFELLSERKQKLYILQELLADLGIEA